MQLRSASKESAVHQQVMSFLICVAFLLLIAAEAYHTHQSSPNHSNHQSSQRNATTAFEESSAQCLLCSFSLVKNAIVVRVVVYLYSSFIYLDSPGIPSVVVRCKRLLTEGRAPPPALTIL